MNKSITGTLVFTLFLLTFFTSTAQEGNIKPAPKAKNEGEDERWYFIDKKHYPELFLPRC